MAAAKPADWLDRLIALPELESPKLSPDGRWLVWSWAGLEATTGLWIVSTDGAAAPRTLLRHADDLHALDWSADGRHLLLSGTKDGEEKTRLYLYELASGTLWLLTPPMPDYYIIGGRLHPGGRWIVYAANSDAQGAATETFAIFRQDIAGNERQLLTRLATNGRTYPTLSPDGAYLLYERHDRHPSGSQLCCVAIDGSNDREIYSAGDARKASGAWSPDGQSIAILAEGSTHDRLGLLSIASGALRWLIDDAQRHLEDVYWPRRSADPVLVESRDGAALASLVDPASGATRPFAGPGSLLPLGPVGEGGDWVVRHYDAQHPDRMVRLNPSRPAEMRNLSPLPASHSVAPATLARPESFHWRSVDGLPIQGWLYRASGTPKGAIIHVHGGPTWHREDSCDAQVQSLVAAGFHVLEPNYRGSTGFGLAFREAIKAEGWGGAEQEDIRCGIEALIAAGIARPGRIGITGLSYGGYSSWCAITRYPPALVAAAVPVCGMTDLIVDYETTRPDLRRYSEEMMGGRPDQLPEKYRARSPIHFVDRIRGRLLIVQGLRDPNVTPENVAQVEQALKAADIPYELLTFADEGHGIVKPANRATLYRRLIAFFADAFGAAR